MDHARVARGIDTKGCSGLRQSIRLRFEAVASSHYGYPPTSVLNNSPASRRAMASNQASEVSVEPFLHSSFPSRKPRRDVVLSRSDRRFSFLPGSGVLCSVTQETRFVVTAFCEHAPGHAREFCGQGDNQDIRVEPLGCCFQPGSKAVPGPGLAPQKYRSGSLNEQCPQITVAAS